MQKSKKIIIEKSIKLFNKKGFQTPVKEIIEESGISNGSFFHYFPKKDCLPLEIFSYIKENLSSVLSLEDLTTLDFNEKTSKVFNTLVDWGVKNHDYFLFLLKFKNSHYKIKEQENILKLYVYFLIEEGKEQEKIKDLDIMFLSDIAISIIAHTIFKIKENKKEKETLKNSGYLVFFDALKK